jgi:hypothetical protein
VTYVVTDNCIKCKYMDCVEVCPVDCFYEGENMLVIHPDDASTVVFANQSVQPKPSLPTPSLDFIAGSSSMPTTRQFGRTSRSNANLLLMPRSSTAFPTSSSSSSRQIPVRATR